MTSNTANPNDRVTSIQRAKKVCKYRPRHSTRTWVPDLAELGRLAPARPPESEAEGANSAILYTL